MTLVTLKLTSRELQLLTALASDQLFRREFIDSRMPGYKFDAADLGLGKALVTRLRLVLDADRAKAVAAVRMAG